MSATARTYSLFGVNVRTAVEFPDALPTVTEDAQLRFELVDRPPTTFRDRRQVFSHPATATPGFRIFASTGGHLLAFDGFADFFLDRRTVRCHLQDRSRYHLIAPLFLGVVIAFWLETRGRCVLHGSAVSVYDRPADPYADSSHCSAACFVGPQGVGKSTLAACLTQTGAAFISDDMLVLEREGTGIDLMPGCPETRLWPRQMEKLFPSLNAGTARRVRHTEKLSLSLPYGATARCDDAPRSIARVYVLSPTESPVDTSLKPLQPREALLMLLSNSFLGMLADCLPAAARRRRLSDLATVAQNASVMQAEFHHRSHGMNRIQELITADLRSYPLAS